MTAQTDVLPDSLESLEFQPQCTAGSAPLSPVRRCERLAVWGILRVPCHCGRTVHRVQLNCEDHYQRVLRQIALNIFITCGHCGDRVARAKAYYLSWTRL